MNQNNNNINWYENKSRSQNEGEMVIKSKIAKKDGVEDDIK